MTLDLKKITTILLVRLANTKPRAEFLSGVDNLLE